MAKCFITGIEVTLEDAQVLDLGAAHRALRDLRQRVAVLERMITQLGERDEVEFFDPRSRATRTRSDRRLVSTTVAQALAAAHPESALFLSWPEYRKRGERLVRELRARAEEAPGAAEPGPAPGRDDAGIDGRQSREHDGDAHPA